jgi:hypothetical protein
MAEPVFPPLGAIALTGCIPTVVGSMAPIYVIDPRYCTTRANAPGLPASQQEG